MVKAEFKKESLMEKLKSLEEIAENEGWSIDTECRFNEIMEKQQQIRLKILGKTGPRRNGGIAWFPKLQKLKDNIERRKNR